MVFSDSKPHNSYNFSDSISGSHKKIIDLVGKDKKVLDLGCSKGYLANKFRENNCYVVGVESDLESAKIAKEFCSEIITADLEQIQQLPYSDNYFDVMVFADILEHLKYPDKILLELKRYLKPEGYAIASLPNISRLDIRLKLLLGQFNYEEAGILDKTHLRFFTLSSIKKLFKECGYKIVSIDYTGLASKWRIFPTCLAFQFIILAKKYKK